MKARAAFLVAFAAVVIGLPLLGRWWRSGGPLACALDGQPIDAVYRVDIVDAAGAHALCCVRCAALWLERSAAAPSEITVTDEGSGDRLRADDAWYVRSLVMTDRVTGNRIHVFRTRSDAEAHADRFGGVVVEPDERPLGSRPWRAPAEEDR